MTDDARLRLGGMALQNGILVHSPDHWAAAVRTPEGDVRVASGRKPELPAGLVSTPLLRGVVRLGEALALLPVVRMRLPEARLPMESPVTGGAMAASTIVSAVLRRNRSLSPLVSESLAASLALVPALVALRGSQLARYHGAEHKAIGGYEADGDAAEATKEHERCGSHLIGPMMAATVAGNVLVRRLPEARRGPARLAAALAAVGVAVETFGWMGRNRKHPVARALQAPGHELQRVAATREPDEAELEVAERALAELLRLEDTAAAA